MIEIIWIVLCAAFDVLADYWFWRGVFEPIPRRAQAHPAAVALGIVCLGLVFGGVATWLWPTPIFGSHGPVGMSLVLIPVLNGVVMAAYGAFRQKRGFGHSSLATLWGGAAFGLGFATARFLLVESYPLGA
jgi:hypothetical protein